MIGADSLAYLSIQSLKNVLKTESLCTACIDGNYPTPNGKSIRLRVLKGEMDDRTTHYEVPKMK